MLSYAEADRLRQERLDVARQAYGNVLNANINVRSLLWCARSLRFTWCYYFWLARVVFPIELCSLELALFPLGNFRCWLLLIHFVGCPALLLTAITFVVLWNFGLLKTLVRLDTCHWPNGTNEYISHMTTAFKGERRMGQTHTVAHENVFPCCAQCAIAITLWGSVLGAPSRNKIHLCFWTSNKIANIFLGIESQSL